MPAVCCGHTHLPVSLRLGDGRLVLNPGGVGLQAFRETRDVPCIVEAAIPDARYAVLTRAGDARHAALHTVAYDFEAMARLAERHDAPDRALARRTGRAPTDHARRVGTRPCERRRALAISRRTMRADPPDDSGSDPARNLRSVAARCATSGAQRWPRASTRRKRPRRNRPGP